ncbi:MAG: hypothetical protein ACYC6A_08520 [Armatimonadota bacterium]
MANRLLLLLLSCLLLSPARAHLMDLPPFPSMLPPVEEISLRTPPSPVGVSDAQAQFLRGPVKRLLVETVPLTAGGGEGMRQPEAFRIFDTHGYAIRAAAYTRNGLEPARLHRELLFTNTYNRAGQRIRQQLTAYADGRLANLVDTTFRYDRSGRLLDARTTVPKYLGSRTKRTFVTTSTFDAAGRLAAEAQAVGKSKLVWEYKPQSDGQERTFRGGKPKKWGFREQVVVNADGKPLRWKRYDEDRGYAEYSFTYNDRGEIHRLVSHLYNGDWVPLYEPHTQQFGHYVYDGHGNWTERTRYRITKQDGLLEEMVPFEKQRRTLTYYESPLE